MKTIKLLYKAVAVVLALSLTSCGVLTTEGIVTAPPFNSDDTAYEESNSGTETGGITEDTDSDITLIPPETMDESSTAVQTEETEPDVDGDTVISFIACGDNLVHQAVIYNGKSYAQGTGRDYNFLPVYEDVASIIKNADIAFVNQESQIAGSEFEYSGYPRFNTPGEMGNDLISLGFDIIQTANNHMLDNGTQGLANTIDYWKNKPVLQIGAYASGSDYDNIRVLEVKGVKIACLSYTDIINSGRTADAPYITPSLEYDTLEKHVKYAKKVADLVFVFVHWGEEDDFDPTSRQVKYAGYMAEMNVDAVIGTHSHVVGPIESIKREDGGEMLCAYSLGNFLSTMYYARNMVGVMLDFDIVKSSGNFSIENVCVIPTVTYFKYKDGSMDDALREGLKIYLLEDFTNALANSHAYNEQESKDYELSDLYKFVTDNVDKEFLPEYLK